MHSKTSKMTLALAMATLVGCTQQRDSQIASGKDDLPSMTRTASEPAGSYCPNGGTRVDTGVDIDGSGTLVGNEIDSTMYLCTAPGGPAQSPRTVIGIESVAVGSGDCAQGGTELRSGLDVNGDGALAPEEIQQRQMACNGGPHASLIRTVPAARGTTVKLDLETSPEMIGNNPRIPLPGGAHLDVIATNTLGSSQDNGSQWDWFHYAVNFQHNSKVLRAQDSGTRYYAFKVQGGQKVSFKSVAMLDEGNWQTAEVAFFAYKAGTMNAIEVREGDVPWAVQAGATTHDFGSVAFKDADMVVIAARQADGISPTPLSFDDIEVAVGQECANGGTKVLSGHDNGLNGGLANNGTLEDGEVEFTSIACD